MLWNSLSFVANILLLLAFRYVLFICNLGCLNFLMLPLSNWYGVLFSFLTCFQLFDSLSFTREIFLQQNTSKLKETISVANNACWAIGELAIKVNLIDLLLSKII